MKKFALVLAVLGIAAAVGYLLGTESGRARRDEVLARLRTSSRDGGTPEIDLREVAGDTKESALAVAETVGDAVDPRG